jgi:hypothetical protein
MTLGIAEHPLQSVVIGVGQRLEECNVLNDVLIS